MQSTAGTTVETEVSNAGQDDGIDILGTLWRHRNLLLLTLLCTTGLGLLYYFTVDPTFESTAELLVEIKTPPAFVEQTGEDRPSYENNVETHAQVISSELIIKQAISDYGLAKLKTFAGEEDLVDVISENLIVEIQDESTSVLTLYYRGPHAEECQDILSGIVQSYHAYLDESSASIGREMTHLITRAKDELLQQLRDREEQYNRFRSNAPLLWKDGEGTNLHHERQSELERARSELVVERTELRARLLRIERAMLEGGESRDAVYFEALKALRPESDNLEHVVERETARGYSGELSREYVELLMNEKQMSDQYGDGHPDLVSVRNRLSVMKQLLESALNNDDEYYEPNRDSLSPLDRDIDYVTVYHRGLVERLESIDRELEGLTRAYQIEQKDANALQHYIVQDETMRSDINRTAKLFDVVVAQLEEINILQDYGGDTMKVLAEPQTGEYVAPSLLLVLIGSVLAGGLLGGGGALLADRFEASFHDCSEIRELLRVPVIGRIPFVAQARQVQDRGLEKIAAAVCAAHRHGSVDAEAYRTIRTALYFGASGQDQRILQITSPMPADGKSTLVANLAVTIAKSNKRVLAVDADFRRPTMHSLFGLEQSPGLSAVVGGALDFQQAIRPAGIENVDILTAGQTPENPSELLSSADFRQLLAELRDQYDFVLVDTPPVLAVTDAAVVAAQVDGVILAFRLTKGIQHLATQAKETLDRMGANVLGVVVNAIDRKSGFEYGYGYGPGYGYDYGSQLPKGRERSEDREDVVRRSDNHRPTSSPKAAMPKRHSRASQGSGRKKRSNSIG